MTTTPLHLVLAHFNNCCPKCGQVMNRSFAQQLAQCPAHHKYGQTPMQLLMYSGMTFPDAEAWLEEKMNTPVGAPIQDGDNARAGMVPAR